MLLSGYSPSMLKLILSGQSLEEVEEEAEEEEEGEGEGEDGEGEGEEEGERAVARPARVVTPLMTLQKALRDSRYDRVREVLARGQEGGLRGYDFKRKEKKRR